MKEEEISQLRVTKADTDHTDLAKAQKDNASCSYNKKITQDGEVDAV